MHYITQPSPDRPGETEVIRTPNAPGRWNTDAIAIASCKDRHMAVRIAELLSQHGEGGWGNTWGSNSPQTFQQVEGWPPAT